MSPTENDFDLRSCVVNLEYQITGVFPRLVVLEKFQVQSETSPMPVKMSGGNTWITGVSNTLAKVVWLIISALILGVISFMIRGGFNVI